MMFIDLKTEDGVIKGKLSFCCRMLNVTRQGFYKYLADKDRPWKYEDLADAMRAIVAEDVCNGTYGRIRMYQALLLKQPEGIRIPGGGADSLPRHGGNRTQPPPKAQTKRDYKS